MSKLGLQVLAWVPGAVEYVLRARPHHLKTLVADPQILGRIKSEIPDCFIVYRHYADDQRQHDLLASPLLGARLFSQDILWQTRQCRDLIDAYEGLNEVGLWSAADRYNEWTAEYGKLMRMSGCKTVAYNFSTGNPPGYVPVGASLEEFKDGLRSYWSHYLDGLREADYLGLHQYGFPTMQTDAVWQTLRHRFVWEALPADCRRPILITECGLDDGGRHGGRNLGWRSQGISEEEYLRQLSAWTAELSRDHYVLGAHIFHAGSHPPDASDPGWDSFSVLGCEQIAEYIRDQSRFITTDPNITVVEEMIMPDTWEFTLGFKVFAEAHPEVGTPAGELIQIGDKLAYMFTSRGLLTWNKDDNQVRFFKQTLPK